MGRSAGRMLALLAALAAMPALAGGRAMRAGGAGGAGPAFAPRQRTAVVARVGDSAELACRVLRLADRTVSWVRSSDLQILTHAGAVFTADARVSCAEGADVADPTEDPYDAADPGPLDPLGPWDPSGPGAPADPGGPVTAHVLRIARLRASDAGRYECQVNTEPKMSLFFNLTVVESAPPRVVVWALGGGTVRAAAGGAARLACGARWEPPAAAAAAPPLRIAWRHAGIDLDPQSGRGGVSLEAERWAGGARSRLTLGALTAADGGRYTCRAHGASATIMLSVGDHDADYPELGEVAGEVAGEMQRDQAVARASAASPGPRPPRPPPALPAALLAALLALALFAS